MPDSGNLKPDMFCELWLWSSQTEQQIVLEEGQWLSLLNLAANAESKRLAMISWQLLKTSLEANTAARGASFQLQKSSTS